MSFTNPTGDRMDDFRFMNGQHSSRLDAMMGLVSPARNAVNGNRLPLPASLANDGRSALTRRFTTDSGRVPTLNSLAAQRAPATAVPTVESQDFGPSTYHKVQLLEKKKLEYERLREQKRRFEAEMQLLDLQQRKEEQELAQMQEDLTRNKPKATHQSEPSTPPEYRETSSGFPTVFSRPNRYSTSSLTSPLSLFNRPGRSGSQLTSPQAGITNRYSVDEKLPSKSVPGSRRNSDEDEKEEAIRQDPTSHRSTKSSNRFSMPVKKTGGLNDFSALDQTNTAGFLFGNEDKTEDKSYLQMANEDNFPTLRNVAQNESESSGWTGYARHRAGQQSLPANSLASAGSGNNYINSQGIASTSVENTRPPNSYRHSLDMKAVEAQQQDVQLSPQNAHQVAATPPKLHSSYSSNDVPTTKSTTNPGLLNMSAANNSHAQQHFHNHNASLGRIPPNAASNRLSKDLTNENQGRDLQNNGNYPSITSALQANAPAFGPQMTHPLQQTQQSAGMIAPGVTQYNGQTYYNNGYNMSMVTHSLQNMQLASMYNPYASYNNAMYQPSAVIGGNRDSQQRVIQQRRQHDGQAMEKYANATLESLGGEIYALCKDQHGCRFLQKKLEDRNPDQVHMIWLETNQHVIELMTDPFGNYLCQKLFEFCNDDERTVLIENASHELVRIALNQHGTRALQKMIEFVSTEHQIATVINALRYQVVDLIQDLNGNHVIQKCLNKLSPTDATFIFEAVGHNCIDVGTHRHGCCVLQRCIDHATGNQKAWLIRQISDHAITLVQDPFGNYVVQYILDLNEPIFTEPLVHMFQGRVGLLARQKFSSNVIEKCLRCASEQAKDMLIEELLNPSEMLKILSDSFANYVVQTALEYSNPQMTARLIEAIRPHLAAIRSTPYGRRIQAKISQSETRNNSLVAQATPNDTSNGQAPLRQSTAGAGAYVSGGPNGGSYSGSVTRGTSGPYPSTNQITNGQGTSNAHHSNYMQQQQIGGGQSTTTPQHSAFVQQLNRTGGQQPGFF